MSIHYQLQNMVLHCIRVLFVTLFASDMAGILQICLFSAPVANSSQWNIHYICCSHGGFPSIHHNELHDITAELMSEVCYNVGTKPPLQPRNEHLIHWTANRVDGTWLDVAADSFWGNDRQHTFLDIRVFNPLVPSYQNTPLELYKEIEQCSV